jgi:hypothetical protein
VHINNGAVRDRPRDLDLLFDFDLSPVFQD